jgi:tetratricopeptide (TPR) repeat protein
MPACPYAPHRLALGEDLHCRHCGGDLRLYAALQGLPIVFYNRARTLWDQASFEEARGWLAAALALRPDLREAHWLLGAVEATLGREEPALRHLRRARELGAEIDPEGLLVAAKPHGPRRRRRKRRARHRAKPRAARRV